MPISTINNASFADTAVHGQRNLIINGGFQCWQRSTDNESTSTSWGYRTVDRFKTNKGRYRKTSDTVDGRTVDVIQIDPSSGVYHGGRGMFTMLEDYNAYDKPTVLSVYIKADAATTADIGQLYDYGGGSTVQAGTTVNITTSWQRFEVQYSAQTFTQAAGHYIINALVDGRTYYVAMAQLETGTQATPFEHRSFGDELRRCQRYYQSIDTNGRTQTIGFGHRQTTNTVRFSIPTPVALRADPSISISGTVSCQESDGSSTATTSISGLYNSNGYVVATGTASGVVLGSITMQGTSGTVQIDAEL